jgi:hypothetical protein
MAAGIDFSAYLIGKRDSLISQPFNLTEMSSAWLEFQYAYAKKYEPLTDSLIVSVSADCGESWIRVFAGGEDGSGNFATHEKTDDFWPETATDWCGSGWGASCVAIDLGNWLGQANIRIAFESYSAIGNPLFIDNISISTYVGEDETTGETTELKIFPNPTQGVFKVIIPQSDTKNTLRIFNPMGQIVYSIELKKETEIVEINKKSDWASGIYFLTITGQNTRQSAKLLIE